MKRWLLAALLLTGLASQTTAQNVGQLSPAVQWMEIKLDRYTVRFPEEFESEGRRVAAILDRIDPLIGETLGTEVVPITVILDNRGATSNGYVSPIPYHSRWYHTPPQTGITGSVDWLTLLAIHEGRHVAQFSKFAEGWSIAAAGVLYGQAGQAALTALSFPGWWLEGDAVVVETLMTESGRGRLPSWEAEFRAAVLEGRTFPLRNLYNGSYVDKLPYLHKYGYLLTAALRNEYGAEKLEDVVAQASDWAVVPWAFGRVLRRNTGETVADVYERALSDRAAEWIAYGDGPAPATWSLLSPEARYYTDYHQPRFLADGTVLALRTGYGDVPALVVLEAGGERVVREIGPSEYVYGYGGGYVAWAESREHPRWAAEASTVLRWASLDGTEHGEISGSHALLGPAISPDGETIAAVEIHRDGSAGIAFFGRSEGNLLSRWTAPRGVVPKQAQWSDRGTVVFATTGPGGDAIHELRPGAETRILRPRGPQSIGWPTVSGGRLRFLAAHDGNQVVYEQDLASGTLAISASSAAGVYWIHTDGEKSVAQMPGFFGYEVMVGELGTASSLAAVAPERSYLEASFGTETLPDFDGLEAQAASYEVAPAGGWGSVYAWGVSPEPGLFLTAESLLGDWSATTEVSYRPPQGADPWAVGVSQQLSWNRWWPTVSLAAVGVLPSDGSSIPAAAQLGVGLPLRFDRGLWSRSLELGTVTLVPLTSSTSGDPLVDHSFAFGSYRRSARRDIYPELGFGADLRYGYSLADGAWRGAASAQAYLPGVARHDGLRLGGAYQVYFGNVRELSAPVDSPRGTSVSSGVHAASASVDYAFPLGYPDLAFWDLSYLKRVRGQLFTDVFVDIFTEYSSVSSGAELWFDFTVLNLPVDLSAGMRIAYNWRSETVRLEDTILGFGIDLP
jgi:hypothetical protein